jgi:hypothetical protein
MPQRQPSRHKALPPTLEAGGVNWKQVSSVRHRIEHQQQTIDMPNGPTISLRWQANTGSTFGPRSSASGRR